MMEAIEFREQTIRENRNEKIERNDLVCPNDELQ